MSLLVHQFPCLEDNYGFLLKDEATGKVGCVDTPDPERILVELELRGWKLDLIINTHWHGDHAGGNEVLRKATGALIVAPQEVSRVSTPDWVIRPGEICTLGRTRLHVLDTGGHTEGHVSYYDPHSSMVFVGDTLFAMGCGRLFEGTAEQMWDSLQELAGLPLETIVYCAHEYTQANSRFALLVDDDPAVAKRARDVASLRALGLPTVPTTIKDELETNPFLRAPFLRPNLSAVDAFADLRRLKDDF
ncbi:MAG TPA: hydroxyacylglutathione hydrolase [Sphingomicrobium sp.]|nr:hydroxyacylglutathione hydrolase [Sphingomicrobium sp.]